jgi:hypothetical protein
MLTGEGNGWLGCFCLVIKVKERGKKIGLR